MRRAVLAALLALLSLPAAADDGLQAGTGVRLGWLRTTGAARDQLASGAPVPEVFFDVGRKGSPLSLEGALSGYTLSGTESGNALFTDNNGTRPTAFSFAQNLFVLPMLLTAKLAARRDGFDVHAGAGLGGVVTVLNQTLGFSDPGAQSALAQSVVSSDASLEYHAQAGADWRVGGRFWLGVLARWSQTDSGLKLFHGFQAANSGGAFFADERAAGNVGGLSLAASAWWKF